MTTPFGIIDIYNGPNVNVGCEFGLKGKVYNYSSIGYYFSGFGNFSSDSWGNLRGGYFLNEIRYYFKSEQNVNAQTDYYWGIEAIYGNQSYVRSDTVLTSQSKNLKIYANKRQFIGLAGNIGVRWTVAKKIMLSLNLGIGLRYNDVKNKLTLEESESRELGDWTVPTNWIQRKGNNLIPKFNLGFKVGFRIN